jgi:hypothetical protein
MDLNKLVWNNCMEFLVNVKINHNPWNASTLSTSLSIHLSIFLPTYLSVGLSICISI